MSDDNLTQEGLEAFAADILNGSDPSDSKENPDQGLVDFAADYLGVADEASDQESSEPEEDQVSDEDIETTDESDDESPVEAEADEEVEDEPTDESESFEVEYDEVKDAVLPIKINGEVKMMKFGEIQNQLARAESASKKSQEANQRQEELDTRESKIAEAEAWAKKQIDSVETNTQLHQLGAHLNQLQAAYTKAAEAQDSHKMIMIDSEIKKYGGQYQAVQQQAQQVKQEELSRTTQAQSAILKEKGYGDIITDTYKDYATSNLSETALDALNKDATLVIALEKARKWDASQGKAKRTLKKSKSLSAGGSKIKQAETNKKIAQRQKMAAGKGSQDDALTGLDDIAKDILGL